MANPFLQGWYGAQQAADARTANELSNFGGLMNIQQAFRQQAEKDALKGAVVMTPDGGLDAQKTLANLYQVSPMVGLQFQAALQKETPFSKVDAKDYTPESVATFSRTRNYADLVPVRKNDTINLGNAVLPWNSYTNQPAGMPIPISVSPDKAATLSQQDRHWSGLSAADAIRLGLSADEHFYNTGRTPVSFGPPAGVPRVTPNAAPAPTPPNFVPMGAPNSDRPVDAPPEHVWPSPASRPQPQGPQTFVPPGTQVGQAPTQRPASNLPPRLQAEIDADAAKKRNELVAKREYNMGGLNEAIDTAERILKGETLVNGVTVRGQKPTGSVVGSVLDSAASTYGISLPGAKEADQLKAIGGALVSKMPRMEGPQSDRDVEMYRLMAADVGNDKLPTERRLAALQEVRRLYGKYDKSGASSNGWSIRPVGQ